MSALESTEFIPVVSTMLADGSYERISVLQQQRIIRTACNSCFICEIQVTYSTTPDTEFKAIENSLARAAASVLREYFAGVCVNEICNYGFDRDYILCETDIIDSIRKVMCAGVTVKSVLVKIPYLTKELIIKSKATDRITGSTFAYELAVKVGFQNPLSLPEDDGAAADYASKLARLIDDPVRLWEMYTRDHGYEHVLTSGLVCKPILSVDNTKSIKVLFSEVRIVQPDVLFKAIAGARLMHTSSHDVIMLFVLALLFGIVSPFAAYLVRSRDRYQVARDQGLKIRSYIYVARGVSHHPWVSLCVGSVLYCAPVMLIVFALRSLLATGLTAVLVGPVMHSLLF